MSPTLLAEYLREIKASGAMYATVEIPLAYGEGKNLTMASTKIAVQFPPEFDAPSDAPGRGGWKLDEPFSDSDAS